MAHVVEFDRMTLSNHAGQNVDLRAVFTEISISTSIFEPGIRGSILVYDAHALVTRFPIVGEETLFLTYKTPGNTPKDGEFKVWKITDERPDSKGLSSTYRLHFCSPSIIVNAQKVVAKSYTNTDDVYAIIRNIQSEYLETEKPTVTGTLPMKDPGKRLVIPMYRPFEAIDMLLRRAYSGDRTKSDYYLFFERHDGWQVKMFDELVTNPVNKRQLEAGVITQMQLDTSPDPAIQQLETWYAYASDKYQMDSRDGKDIRRIIGLNLGGRFDTIQKIRQGQLENEIVQYSIVEKSLSSLNYKLLKNEQRYLGGSTDPYRTSDRHGGTGKERTNTTDFISGHSTIESGFSGTQASQVYFRLKDPEEKDGVVKKSGWLYQAIRTALTQIQITITVPGDTMVDVGDVVHLTIPKFESVLERGEPDDFLYGRYIVGAIRDSILTPDKHVMTLDLWRDSFWKPISMSKVLDENDTQ